MKSIDLLKLEVKDKLKNDPAHDFEHIMRVYRNAQMICKHEKANERLVLAAALLHDIISYPKSDKRSKNSSIESAKKSRQILKKHDYSNSEIDIVYEAILTHSFSQNSVSDTMEGKILQDADRLDALGAIGIARVFATGGSLGRVFYNSEDPFCKKRDPEDKIWTVDHFFQKLFRPVNNVTAAGSGSGHDPPVSSSTLHTPQRRPGRGARRATVCR